MYDCSLVMRMNTNCLPNNIYYFIIVSCIFLYMCHAINNIYIVDISHRGIMLDLSGRHHFQLLKYDFSLR